MRFLILSILTLGILGAAEEAPNPLPKDAQTAITALQVDLSAYEKKQTAALLAKLQPMLKRETQKGNLDAANALKQYIDEKQTALDITAASAKPYVGSSKDVILYPLPNFKGDPLICKTFDSIIDAYKVRFPSDGLRSVRVPPGYTLTVFENELGGGKSAEITADVADLTGNTIALGMTSFCVVKSGK
jgi:hypothetical protein